MSATTNNRAGAYGAPDQAAVDRADTVVGTTSR